MTGPMAGVPFYRHFIYWMLPTAITALLVLFYFSGIGPLRDLVAPPINREYGLLENLQLAIILSAAGVGIVGMRRAGTTFERAAFGLFSVGSLFILLEEMDYGLHFWEFVFGSSDLTIRNIHNQDDNLRLFKRTAAVITGAFFVVLPLAATRIRHPLVRYFAPDPMIVTTVVAGIVVGEVAHYLQTGHYPNGPLDRNISEFRETFTYYMVLLYSADLALHRKWPGLASLGRTAAGGLPRRHAH
jgi:hypothetical protein